MAICKKACLDAPPPRGTLDKKWNTARNITGRLVLYLSRGIFLPRNASNRESTVRLRRRRAASKFPSFCRTPSSVFTRVFFSRQEGAPVATTGTAVPTGPTPAQTAASIPAPPAPVADGPSISHYDETTGVPLTREAVASQLSLGHTVVPLSEAYNRRLSRLQVPSAVFCVFRRFVACASMSECSRHRRCCWFAIFPSSFLHVGR